MAQLSLLQRVSKRVQDVIIGSKKLRVKMFLEHGHNRVEPDKLLDWGACPLAALFDPLLGINHQDSSQSSPQALFRYFEFAFGDTDNRRLIGIVLGSARCCTAKSNGDCR